jgi:xanthine dehydrogenase accessory factor
VTPVLPGPFPGLEGRKLLLVEGREPQGGLDKCPDVLAELRDNLAKTLAIGKPGSLTQTLPEGGTLACFLEPLKSRPVVYLFGGGHVALPLAKLVKMVDFSLIVVDDRDEFANAERYPEADEIWVRSFEGVLEGEMLGPEAYIVIVTRGHLYDKDVLAQTLQRETAYVGMIGSRRKRNMVYQALRDEGFTEDQLARVHSPIGLDIAAETPEEIAVSIVAELIAVRAKRSSEVG